VEIIGISQNGRFLRAYGTTIEELMIEFGELPLPPYISYDSSKERDYQTVFAEKSGSVAAPTASLHFTRELIEKLPHEQIYITLHVGLGTFQWVDTPDIRDYHIHRETVEITASLWEKIATLKKSGKKILAVGTTVCRTIESLPFVWKKLTENERKWIPNEVQKYWDNLTRDIEDALYISDLVSIQEDALFRFGTSIFIYPGKRFSLVDDLITNFHLPESSLLMLVSAFIGREEILATYEAAIEKKYRFFSFWDGMYLRSGGESLREKKMEEK
jgi:S-adenosylmethionine:tRNA ribosyltransferase-isomerase